MPKFKEMPYKEKYELAEENVEFLKGFVRLFVRNHLDDQAMVELQNDWNEGLQSIPKTGSFIEKYETAYSNWIWIAKSDFNFIRNKLGKKGLEKFHQAEVEALKKKNAGPAVSFLGLMRKIAPGYAFFMATKEFSYQLQWITPFTATEMNQRKAVFDIPRCKILDFKETGDICRIGCQSIYPAWTAEQFKVKMGFERNGRSCKCILTPIT